MDELDGASDDNNYRNATSRGRKNAGTSSRDAGTSSRDAGTSSRDAGKNKRETGTYGKKYADLTSGEGG